MVLIVDDLLVAGIRFVLGKVVQAVDAELNDDTHLREELLAAQMRLELGEIDEQEFAEREAEILDRLRAIKEQRGGHAATEAPAGYRVSGIEATFLGEETKDEPEPRE